MVWLLYLHSLQSWRS